MFSVKMKTKIKQIMSNYGFTVLEAYSKDNNIEFINDKHVYFYVDIDNCEIKIWKNDIHGQRPIYMTNEMLSIISDINDVLHNRYQVLNTLASHTDVYSHLGVIQMNITKNVNPESYEIISNYMKGLLKDE